MGRIAVQEALNGKMVDWMEKVSDAEYEDAVLKAGSLPPPQ